MSCQNESLFIAGDRFTAADLSFAALASPLLDVDQIQQPSRAVFPSEVQGLTAELRSTIAGQHALRMFEDYRFATFQRHESARSLGVGTIERAPAPAGRKICFRSGAGGRNNTLLLAMTGAAAAAPIAFGAAWATRASWTR